MACGLGCTVDCKKLEYEAGTRYAGSPSCVGIGVGGQSYSNFLAFPCRLNLFVQLEVLRF